MYKYACGLIASITMFFLLQNAPFAPVDKQYGDYLYKESISDVQITGYAGSGGDIEIPSGINGKPVTGIGDWAFLNKDAIQTVVVPDSITAIGKGSFSGCGITQISIPDSVTKIGDYAFSHCESLQSIDLPDQITKLSIEILSYCYSLSTVTIPAGVVTIDTGALGYSGIESIIIPGNVTDVKDNAFFGCYYLSSVNVEENVKSIGDNAFSRTPIADIVLPDSIETLGRGVFSDCASLSQITLPQNLKLLPPSIFMNCTSLQQIVLPDSITTIDEYAFYKCNNLKSIVFPGNLEQIGDYAFYKCASLAADFVLPASMRKIGNYAFNGCQSIQSIGLNDGLETIGGYAFQGCKALAELEIPSAVASIGYRAIEGNTVIDVDSGNQAYSSEGGVLYNKDRSLLIRCPGGLAGEFAVPPGVTNIEDWAFVNCYSLTKVVLPDGLISLGQGAFYDCQRLKNVNLPSSFTAMEDAAFFYCYDLEAIDVSDGNPYYCGREGALFNKDMTTLLLFPPSKPVESYTVPEGIVTIGKYAFMNNSKLGRVTLSTSVKTIEKGAFESCSLLQNINIPDSVTMIEEYAFAYSNLKEITIPSSVTSISPYTFTYCMNLEKITIPESVTSIGDGAFGTCSILKSIELPSLLVTIGDKAFMQCISFESVYFNGPLPGMGAYVFASAGPNLKLYYHVTQSESWKQYSGLPAQPFCRLTLDTQGESAPQTMNAPIADGKIAVPPMPTRAGYSLTGWYREKECQNKWDFANDHVSGDITLYAKWEINTYLVSFDPQGGSRVEGVYAVYDSLITEPSPPNRTGFTFEGWFKEAACRNAWDFMADKVSDDVTLYAKWKANSHTVRFNTQGGSSIHDILVAHGEKIPMPAAPTRSGCAFGGWYKEASCQNKWNFGTDRVSANITLYAKWTVLAAPASPKAASCSYNSVKVSWNAVAGAAGYEIWRAAASSGKYTKAGASSTASFVNSGLTTGATYYYKVRAYAPYGSSYTYGPWSPVVSIKPLPAAPASITAAPQTYNSIKITWTSVAGATKYEVYRSTAKTGTYKLLAATAALSYLNTSVNTGTTYYYKVRAYRLVGSTKVYGGYSAVAAAKTSLKAPSPVRAARASATSVKVTWGAVAGATRYEVWRSTSAKGTFSLAGTASAASFLNTRLTTGRTYYYKVRAYRLVGSVKVYSGFSVVVSAKP